MENQEKQIHVNIEHYNGEKPIEVILRQGVAAAPQEFLPTKAPLSIDIAGVIDTPLRWLEKRVDTIDQKKAHIVVNREGMGILLRINETDDYTMSEIGGKVSVSEIFAKLGINNTEKWWTPAQLGQFLRLNRGIFIDKQQCMTIVSKLKNFTANAKTQIEKVRDASGSIADVYRSEVESNLPKSFIVELQVFKGTSKQNIEVEFDHFVKDNEVYLQLVSPGANEAVLEYRDRCIDDVLSQIREIATDIAILEV